VAGVVRVPGDKSISHRGAILAALAEGVSHLRGFSPAGDCRATLTVLRSLGVSVDFDVDGDVVTMESRGAGGLAQPGMALDCGRSGTTMRLMAGVLAGTSFRSTLVGDEQLLRRPMARVAEPLRRMGAAVELSPEGTAPVTIHGARLTGIEFELPVPSAQVKSAVLLAGLRALGPTVILEAIPSRDHTERLLEWLGGPIVRTPGRTTVRAGELRPFDLDVPGDVSSAAPLLAAAALVPGSNLTVRGVGLNPTRTGFLRVMERMGVEVETLPGEFDPEPAGDLTVRPAPLRAVTIEAAEVPALIDELPLVGVLATQADGDTSVRGAAELRLKESDRIAGLMAGLRALGADAEELPDGFVVRGPVRLRGGVVDARSDHRLAMAFTVAGLVALDEVDVRGLEYLPDSFPGFAETLGALR